MHPDKPFSPKRLPFFYGWLIIPLSSLGFLMSMPGQTIGVSAFTDSLIEVTGLSRLNLSIAYLAGTCISGFILPLGGRFFDRHGARKTIVYACLLLGFILFILSQIDRIINALNPGGLVMPLLIMISAFFLLRFSGQGMITLASQNMLGKWFKKYRGRASGIAGIVKSMGFALMPYLYAEGVEHLGWRNCWLLLAGISGIGMSFIGYLFFRDNPEECGMKMDGEAPQIDDENTPAKEEYVVEPKDAFRTAAFWSVASSLSFYGMVLTGITFHIESLGQLAGLPDKAIFKIFIPMAAASPVMGMLLGYLSDKLPVKYLVIAMQFFQIACFVGFANMDSSWGWWLAALAGGTCGGFFGTLSNVAMPHYFGRLFLGAISGRMLSAMVIGSALGPLLFSISEQVTGNYPAGLYLSCVLPMLSFILAIFIREPERENS